MIRVLVITMISMMSMMSASLHAYVLDVVCTQSLPLSLSLSPLLKNSQ